MQSESAHVSQIESLADEGRRLASLGFMACTSGNLSVRLSRDGEPVEIAISAAGRDKATLAAADFLRVDAAGRVRASEPRRPSEEVAVHLAIYAQLSEVRAVAHGHLPHAVALSLEGPSVLRFAGLEMLKAFAGAAGHEGPLLLPVIENSRDVADLARGWQAARVPDTPAVVVRGHGAFAWGRSPAEAARHLEAVEWLCRVELLRRAAHPGDMRGR